MKISQAKNLSPAVYQFQLTATAAEFEVALQATYEAQKGNYTLDGYAKGEAPRAAIEAQEGEQIFTYDAINRLLSSEADALLQGAIVAAGLTPLTAPDYDVTQCDKDGFCMEIVLGTLPEVQLGNYKGIAFAYPPMPTAAGAVDTQLNALRQRIAATQGKDAPLPALDDAFAQRVSDCDTLAALREKIAASLAEYAKGRARVQGQFLLLEKIGQDSALELPEYLLKKEYETAMQNLEAHLAQYGVPFETYLAQQGKTKEQFEAENHQSAIKAVRAKLAAYTIAKAEGICISEAELESELVRVSAIYKKTVQQFKAEHPAYLVKNDLLLSRTIAFLEQHNTLTLAD